MENFSSRICDVIKKIPAGRVTTYGIVAEAAGNRCGARQVARILHSCSKKYDLPWHRVINREGKISLGSSQGAERQRRMLEDEDVVFDERGRVDFDEYLWFP